MRRILWVGDPHVEPHDIQDAINLANLVYKTCENNPGVTVVIAGDLYHTHGIIHADVLWFWHHFFENLRKMGVESIVIKGNHDMPGTEGSLATSLLAHTYQTTAVLYEPLSWNGILFCPYTHDPEQLVGWSNEHPECKTLMCHATFDGSMFDNGFYAPEHEAVRPGAILQQEIISGHIHRPQQFDKVWYPGAPRWKTKSDANEERATWLLDFADDGVLQDRKPVSTGDACRRIYHRVDTPDDEASLKHDPRHDYRVDSIGPAAWLETRKPLFAGWARWHGVKTDTRAAVQVRESEGVQVAFSKWLAAYEPKYGTSREVLEGLVKERVRAL